MGGEVSKILSLDELMESIGREIGSQKDVDIANALKAGRSTLSTWRKREFIPYANIVEFCLERNIPVEEILTGRKPPGKPETLYETPQDALMAVLEVQEQLDLIFSAGQIKAMIGFAYKTQASREQLVEFVIASSEFANKTLVKSTDIKMNQ